MNSNFFDQLFSAQRLKDQAARLGFNLVGIARAEPSPQLEAYFRWLDAGMHAEMGYLARPDRLARRRDLNVIVPDVQSLVIVALDYHTQAVPAPILNDPARGRIAAYAWGVDYHTIMTPRLKELGAWLQAQCGTQVQQRAYVDTGAILERSHAQQAGLGFVGKNTLLINQRRGSYFFLGELVTQVRFDAYDQPAPASMCGSCTRCQVACPTAAFPQPYVLDARRCISYLTIEHKGIIDPALRPLMGNWIMGCDICQDVCPWQKFAVQTQEAAFFPVALDRAAPPLLDLLALDQQAFDERFGDSPVARLTHERLLRNACIAAGNWGAPEALPALSPLLIHSSPLVQEHARWAWQQVQKRA